MTTKTTKNSNTPSSLEELVKAIGDQSYPPVEKWEPDFCGDIDIKIGSDGTWYYMNSPIGRAKLVKLFSSVLRHDEDGEYYLVTPVEKMRIEVEKEPLIVVELMADGEGRDQILTFRTLTDDLIRAGRDHKIKVDIDEKTKEPYPTLFVRGRLSALINRPVFYELVELASPKLEGDTEIGVWSEGEFFVLGSVEE